MSSQNIDNLYNTTAPFSYSDWSQRVRTETYTNSVNLYNEYLQNWYVVNTKINDKTNSIKQDYINLLKELTYFFNEEEKDLFLKDIDFTNDTEIIYAIPFFVQKLKEVAFTLSKKRNYIKSNRKKYDSIGSSQTLESILYEYILKSHTKSNNTTQISLSTLGSVFPELSAVKNDFIIEIQEIYDDSIYADNDPSVEQHTLNTVPLIGNNPLFNVFADYLNTEITSLSSTQDYDLNSASNIFNIVAANSKYLGNNIYSVSATKATDNNMYNAFFNIVEGNNWFYWPSGEIFTDVDTIINNYIPIPVQASQFTVAESTAGSSYTNSDLLFVENNGHVEGAWLCGTTAVQTTGLMVMTAQPNEIRSFIYPTPGYGLTNTYKFSSRVLNDENLITFNLLDPELKSTLIKQYFSAPINTDISVPVYLNNTNLVYNKATAGSVSLLADNMLIRPKGQYNDMSAVSSAGVYTDQNTTTAAFLYKLTSTELPIGINENYIEWPLTSNISSSYENYIHITSDTCNDVRLGYININSAMVGAVAGDSIDNADVIYKLASKASTYIEAAWLHGGSTTDLAVYNSYSIPVYNTPATKCVVPPKGVIQPNLSFTCEANKKISFVWCDIDTPADEVFKYIPHALDCPYLKNTHSYLKNNTSTDWVSCTCKSPYYSPIGHTGDNLADNRGITDFIFADPQALGSNFTLTNWRDTRDFNYKNSPQFAFFQKNDSSVDDIAGWGPGRWKTGDGSRMILKTGRRYTYFRSSLKNASPDLVPPMIGHYAYKRIISSVTDAMTHDIVLVIDISGSQYFSIEKTKALATRISNFINTQSGSQISVLVFNENSIVASYLTRDKQSIIKAIQSIKIESALKATDITTALHVAATILTQTFGLKSENSSLVGLCSNLDVSIQTPFALISTTNIPDIKNKKTVILFSDGDETTNRGQIIQTANSYKAKNIQFVAVDIGPNSSATNYMEQIASSTEFYFNYEAALLQDDSNNQIENFTSCIISAIYGNISMQPVWRKAKVDGLFILPLYDISDMVLRPGDYLKYSHRTEVMYGNTSAPSAPFLITIPLYGWDYRTKKFDGVSPGAKPYWGKMYNYPGASFTKFARDFGGAIRYFADFIPLSHPEVSNIQLQTNDYIEYRNNGCEVVVWTDVIEYNASISQKQWYKLKLCTQPANLKELFTSNSLDKIIEQSTEPSDILLSTIKDYTPSYYCYYARNDFTVVQPLTAFADVHTYSAIQTAVAIKAVSPYLNLTNTHYATIANKQSLDNLVTIDDTGYFLLPTKIGTPYYLGKGYVNELDTALLEKHTEDIVYLDPAKYTSNRGLTKKDQFSPYVTTHIDNTWLKESYNSERKAGMITNAAKYQKFVPYNTNYETYNHNVFGLSRQDDKFEFWTGLNNNIWNDETIYPTNYKKEVYQLNERTQSLLINGLTITSWQTDLYGNNYGLYKNTENKSQSQIRQSNGSLWVRDINNKIVLGSEALKLIYINYVNNTEHYNNLINNNIIQFCIINDHIVIQTAAGVSIDKISFNYDTGIFSPLNALPNYIPFDSTTILNKIYYAGMWYNEESKLIYFNTFKITDNAQVTYHLYEYNMSNNTLKLILVDDIMSPCIFNEINSFNAFTYNKETHTFNTTFIFKAEPTFPISVNSGNLDFNLFYINVKNIKNNPYIVNVSVGV